MTPDKKYRVTCIKDYVGTAQSDEPIENSITYCYVDNLEEAKRLMKTISDNGAFQSELSDNRTVTFELA